MKRLSVGSQGTVDHQHRVKIQRRGGTRNFRTRQFRADEKWTKPIRPSAPTVLTQTTRMIAARINQFSAFVRRPPAVTIARRTGYSFRRGTNLIYRTKGVYTIRKNLYAGIACYRRAFRKGNLSLLSKAPHGSARTCVRMIRARVYVRTAFCLVYLFYFILVYLSGKKRCPAAISSFASTASAASAIFYTAAYTTLACIFLHGARAPALNRVTVGFVSFRYRMFMWQRRELNVRASARRCVPAPYSFSLLSPFPRFFNSFLFISLINIKYTGSSIPGRWIISITSLELQLGTRIFSWHHSWDITARLNDLINPAEYRYLSSIWLPDQFQIHASSSKNFEGIDRPVVIPKLCADIPIWNIFFSEIAKWKWK